ncbi:MAG: hypothetical protein WC009_13605 [Methylotenera sp.]
MIKNFVVFVAMISLVGCTSAINKHNAENYTRHGAIAMANNDWQGARRAFARAVVNADMGGMPAETRAVLNYEYGRSLGVTCFFDDADYYLKRAYALDKETGAAIYLSLVELARLHLDQKKYTDAAMYFEQALTELDRNNFAQRGPIGYADILDETVTAFNALSRNDEATQLKLRSQTIRAKHPDGKSITDRTPYGKFCH